MSDSVAVFLFRQVRASSNSTQYQRAKSACDRYGACFLTRREVCDDIEDRALHVEVSGEDIFHRLILPLWLVWKVLLLNREHNIRYVHTSHMPQAILAGFLLQRLGFIWVADLFDTPHFGLDLEGDPVGVGRYLSRLYNNLLLSQTRRVVVDADLVLIAMVPEAFESYGIDPDADNVLHVTNGTKVEATRRVWSDREVSSFRVLYIGPVRRARGLDILIDALESLEGTVDDVELRLVGPIHDATWLMNELDKLADVIVTILGQVPHERALQEVDQATVCTCPLSPEVENYHYSYPIKVFEYMALGKPIVATRMQGTSEILEDGRTGLLVPPDDSKALANAIQTLARDQQLRQKLSANASESVKKYDWEQINDRIFERIQVVSS